MRQFFRLPLISIAILLGLLVTGCKGEDIIIETGNQVDTRRVSIAGPAATISYSLADLVTDIDEPYVRISPDGSIYFLFEQEVTIDWGSLVRVNDASGGWFLPVVALPPGTQPAIAGREQVRLNPLDDMRYDSLSLAGGTLTLQIQVPPGSYGTVDVNIPHVTRGGSPLSALINVNPAQSNYNVPIDLAGVRVTPGQTSAAIPFLSYITLETYASLSGFSGQGNIGFSYSISGVSHHRAYGFFGQQEANRLDARLEFKPLEELAEVANIEFANIMLDVKIENPIGVPFFARAQNTRFFRTIESTTPDWVLRLVGANDASINISPATYGPPVTPSVNTIFFNPENSNIVEIGNNIPVKLLTDLYSVANPEGFVNQNFIGRETYLPTTLVFTVPLMFRASGYTRIDTIAFDFRNIVDGFEDEARDITRFDLFLDFSSNLPVDITANAWVIDGQGNKIDDLLPAETLVIKAGSPATSNSPAVPGKTSTTVSLTTGQINMFLDQGAKHIVMESNHATYREGGVTVTLRDDMTLEGRVSFNMEGHLPGIN